MYLKLMIFTERAKYWLVYRFVWLLPKWVIYYATIRCIAYATTGKYADTIAPELTALDALKRWNDTDDRDSH